MGYSAGKSELYSLVLQSIEGRISESDFVRLEKYLQESSEYREIYSDLNIMYAYLRRPALTFSIDFDAEQYPTFDTDFWKELAEDEKTAPEIEISQEKSRRELIQKVVYPPREKLKVSKFSIAFLAMNAAAILFIALFLKFVPSTHSVEVATLSDSINAKWADIDASMQKGTRLTKNSNKLMLREGLVELSFDNHAKTVIEAPAEFQILADDRIGLNYGKVYATVPKEAIGFSVYTPTARIIDLGTEFGVQAEADGDTQLYVLKGKTSLIAGDESHRTSIEVTENTAKRVSGVAQTISDIPCNSRLFIREIDSHEQVAWRGENMELASIIAGGNGFDPVFNERTLNPNTGDYEQKPLVSSAYPTNSSYNRVSGNVFIDGVFVPDGSNGPVTITSQGHHFDCPATSGNFNRNIAVFYKSSDKVSSDMQPALFDGVVHGSQERPCVLLHSNVGITINLDRIRQAYPGRKIEQLQTRYGLTWAEKNGKADFFILVDGVLKHEDKALASQENSQSATVTLEPDARFLTFVVTDDQKSSRSSDMAYEFDFFYLLEPQLVLR